MTSRLIYGFHAVISKLRHDPESIKEILIDATRQDARARDLLKHAELQGTRVIATDGKRLDGMAPDGKHQGVVARIEGGRKAAHLDDVLDTLEEPAFLLVLDGITDPRNLGACLRVADAAGVHAVIAPKDRAVGLTDVAAKTACGAAETVPYVMVTNLARTLRELQ
ncbi:MAG: 23S rRNA (guanosine(2251)-2'-O)-methyltransferase RlmB, partial [Dechloromonas sp.]|nr:23S rRNA (guanosine(2251)-2'-O)-methyltransferase RlmB [Dechloromonas sp.]